MREAPIAQSRAAQWEWITYMGELEPLVRCETRFIPSLTAEIPVRIYTPAGQGPFATLVAFHGGCWIVGNIDVADRPHRALANATGCVVVAVNYQKAPEHPFPVPLDDCWAAFAWTVEHAGQLGLDPARVGVVGDSAGGNSPPPSASERASSAERSPPCRFSSIPPWTRTSTLFRRATTPTATA
jgi:acetyl esterase